MGTSPSPQVAGWIDAAHINAFFSHYSDQLLDAELLDGPDNHPYNEPCDPISPKPLGAFRPTGDDTAWVLVRKMNNEAKWLVGAFAATDGDREIVVSVPDLGDITLNARTMGSVYLFEQQDGQIVQEWLDEELPMQPTRLWFDTGKGVKMTEDTGIDGKNGENPSEEESTTDENDETNGDTSENEEEMPDEENEETGEEPDMGGEEEEDALLEDLPEPQQGIPIVVYPNQTGTNELSLEYLGSWENLGEVRIYDLNGRMVREFKKEPNVVQENLPITGLSAGVYLVRSVFLDGGAYTQKIVVKK